jgi:hypothetical protein
MNAYGGAGGMPSGAMPGTPDVGQRQAQGGTGPGGMPAATPGKGISLGADRGITLSGTWKVSFTLDSDT